MIFNQQEFDIRLEWGLRGVEELSPLSDVIIIVDVLSFSTCVDIATDKGALIFPYRWKDDETVIQYAKSINAEIADFKRKFSNGFSLSPTSLLDIKCNTRLVLPSPNGSALTLSTNYTPTICGCLRNAKAVADYAMKIGKKISIIPAGERWGDNTIRVAFEDLLGAGSIISFLKGSLSPESKSSLAVFNSSKSQILTEVKKCSSGKELIERGFVQDLELACDLNTSINVPILKEGHYVGQRL
ncbi:MAG: 2-phosphosulfolactate phosphatase [Chitinophagaceae bacterium]